MKPLALHEKHAGLSATFGPLAEHETVLNYGDVGQEAKALQQHAGLIDWSGGTRLRVSHTGSRTAVDFVEGLLSNTLLKREEHEGCYATLLTHTGKVLSDCRVWVDGDVVFLTTESKGGPALRDGLTKYGFIDDIEVEDISSELGVLGLYGPDAAAAWAKAVEAPLPESAPLVLVDMDTPVGSVELVHASPAGQPGVDIFAPPNVLASLWDTLVEAGASPVGSEGFHLARIEAGLPWVGYELDDRVLPNAAGLEHAISYTKGCYVGQEAVAKLHYLGKSNITLIGLRLGNIEPPAYDTPVVQEDKPVGRITSAVVSPQFGETIALGFCRNAVVEKGQPVLVGDAEAHIMPLPFA